MERALVTIIDRLLLRRGALGASIDVSLSVRRQLKHTRPPCRRPADCVLTDRARRRLASPRLPRPGAICRAALYARP